jgi:hypothetical protein
MADNSKKKLPKEFYERRSGFSIFDFYKHPGWRLGTGSDQRGPVWYISVVLSFAFAILAAWNDIVGGASFMRIAVILILVSGLSFYFLIRWQQSLLWSAVLAASGAALAVVLQLRFWLLDDNWPGWAVKDLPVFNELLAPNPSGFLLWFGDLSAILALVIASLVLLMLTVVFRRF